MLCYIDHVIFDYVHLYLSNKIYVLFLSPHNSVSWLFVLGFNATLTTKVTSWPSVTHMCFLAFSFQNCNTTFLSKATNYFSHMLLQKREAKIRRKKFASTGDRSHSHQVMSPTRSLLNHPGGAHNFVVRGYSSVIVCGQVYVRLCLPCLRALSRPKLSNLSRELPLVRQGTLMIFRSWGQRSRSLSEEMSRYAGPLLNPFPDKPWFSRVCITSLSKTQLEKEKLLVTSNFSFSDSVF